MTIDEDVYEAAAALSRASGQTLGVVLSQLARRGLRVHGDFATKSGLHVFSVPADAPLIPSSRARQIEDELE